MAIAVSGCASWPDVPSTQASEITYVLLPHPDDEFQVWSQIENREGDYTVFILMTRGEESTYCNSHFGGGVWTKVCANKRVVSWLHFMRKMGAVDQALPSRWARSSEEVRVAAPDSVAVERVNGERKVVDKDAQVWLDLDGRGAMVAFDLGDGDLTRAEAEWAAGAVINDPTSFGLPDLPPGRVLGAYWYDGETPGCAQYPHDDHRAVAQAILSGELKGREHLVATCGLDPDVAIAVRSDVSQEAATAVFGSEGAFPEHYGWLGTWTLATDSPSELFHVPQAFQSH